EILIDMVYYILVGIFSSNLLYHKKDCFPTLLRVVAVFFYCAFFYSALLFHHANQTGERCSPLQMYQHICV
ncbi:MAG: hypothetical protein U0K34_10700, partial [Ruminococcus sp.]|nr:hypothetical protein [Ruminococcus sp.]